MPKARLVQAASVPWRMAWRQAPFCAIVMVPILYIPRRAMTKYATATMLPLITIDPSARVPLYQQLYDELRTAILTGQLAPGARLPATRELATTLGVARNAVLNAFDQLLAEGYLEGRVGDGTYVTRVLPDDALYVGMAASAARDASPVESS